MTTTDTALPAPSPEPRIEPEPGLSFLTALLAIRRQLHILVLLAMVGTASGALIGLSQPTVFSSTAMLTVRPTSPDLQLQMPPLATSYASLAKTDAVAARFRTATGSTLSNELLFDKFSVSTSAATPDIFLTAQAGDPESARVAASAWVQALIAQVDSTKGGIRPGGDLVVLAAASQGTLTSSPSIVKSSLIGLCAGLLLGLAAALAVDAARQRGSRAAVAARRGVPVVFVSAGPTSRSALDDGARVVLAMLHPASAGPGRLVIVDLRDGPTQGAAADAIGRTLAAQGVPATVLSFAHKKEQTALGARLAGSGLAAGPSASGSVPRATVLPIAGSSTPARWALSAAGRKEMAVLSQTQQVIIEVPFDVSRSDALAISAHAPGVIVVAGPRTRAKDFDEALALLNAVSPMRLVAMITERRRGRYVAARLTGPLTSARSGKTADTSTTHSAPRARQVDGVTPSAVNPQRADETFTSSTH
jgi:capsular polysaccharide biosynthesis protein